MDTEPGTALAQHQLREACRRGDRPRVLALLAAGVDPNAPDDLGWTPLHEASATGSAAVCLDLLSHGANAGSLTAALESPLHLAAATSATDITRALLCHGADARAVARLGGAPLAVAASHGRTAQVELLVGASRASGSELTHALSLAVLAGEGDCARVLVRSGGDPSVFGGTRLHSLVWSDDASALCQAMASERGVEDGDLLGFTPVTLAASLRSLDMVQLLARVASTAAYDPGAWTPLEVAAHAGALDIVEWLLADERRWCPSQTTVRSTPPKSARAPAFMQGLVASGELLAAVEDRLVHPPDGSVRREALLRALYVAIRRARVDVVARLLREGADGNAYHPNGTPMLAYAILASADTAECLLLHGVDPNAASRQREGVPGRSVLHDAIVLRKGKTVAHLLAAGADPEGGAAVGEKTPLMESILTTGDAHCAYLLLAAGADPDRQCHHGVTPRSVAKAIGRPDLIWPGA